jgi:aspartokinase-like uncharacterized kinase
MNDEPWTVVKVGGSLYDLPDLRERLRAFLTSLQGRALLFPGGGATADVIRAFDRVHGLGEEASHWLALQALALNARFLQALLPEYPIVPSAIRAIAAASRVVILDPSAFFRDDERLPEHLPHRWEVTSDSHAVRVASVLGAGALVLLKSVDWSGNEWQEAARNGTVDAYFVQALANAPGVVRVRVVNLRTLR